MKRPAWLTRDVLGWTAFDFANQAFTMVMVTAMFHVYFIDYIVPASETGSTDFGHRLWEISVIIAEVLVIAVSPVLGALADFTGAKKWFLFATYVGCVAATFALGLVGPGDVAWAMTLFILGYLFFGAGENFLNAFLPEIADHRHMGRVSAFSWAVAYCGSILSLGVAVILMQSIPSEVTAYRWVAVWCGLYFLLGGMPTFVMLKERKKPESLPAGQTMWSVGFQRLAATFHEIRTYRQLFRYLVIVTIYIAGMQVVIFYAGDITKNLFQFTQIQQGLFLLQITVTGVIGAVLTGAFQDRLGTKWTIMLWLLVWSVTMLLTGAVIREENGVTTTPEWQFWFIGNFVGISMGALGTSSRALAGLFSPEHKAGEFFGFYGMALKLAVILGMGLQLVLGLVGVSRPAAIGASAVFFITGLILMFTIDEREGRTAALRASRDYRRTLARTARSFLITPAPVSPAQPTPRPQVPPHDVPPA